MREPTCSRHVLHRLLEAHGLLMEMMQLQMLVAVAQEHTLQKAAVRAIAPPKRSVPQSASRMRRPELYSLQDPVHPPDVAAVDVHWEMTGATDAQGNPRPDRRGLLSFTMGKNTRQWQIVVMHNLDLTAPPPSTSPNSATKNPNHKHIAHYD